MLNPRHSLHRFLWRPRHSLQSLLMLSCSHICDAQRSCMRALLTLVGADAQPQTLLAPAPLAVMLAYLRSPAIPRTPCTRSCGVCGGICSTPGTLLLMRLCSHICDPSHSLHRLFSRLWGQMLDPRHSLHSLLRQQCSHICDPPHSLHSLLTSLPQPPNAFFGDPCRRAPAARLVRGQR
jgi:hypothetical protein